MDSQTRHQVFQADAQTLNASSALRVQVTQSLNLQKLKKTVVQIVTNERGAIPTTELI